MRSVTIEPDDHELIDEINVSVDQKKIEAQAKARKQ